MPTDQSLSVQAPLPSTRLLAQELRRLLLLSQQQCGLPQAGTYRNQGLFSIYPSSPRSRDLLLFSFPGTSLPTERLSPGDCVCALLAGFSCSLPMLLAGSWAGGAALQGERAVVPESHESPRQISVDHPSFSLELGSTQVYSLTHHPMPSCAEQRENTSTAAWPHGWNLFSLFLTTHLEKEPTLKTSSLRKSPFIRKVEHRRSAVLSCQTHVQRALGQTDWIMPLEKWSRCRHFWTNRIVINKMPKAQEVPEMNWKSLAMRHGLIAVERQMIESASSVHP